MTKTAFVKGRKKEVAEMAKKKWLKEEVEKQGLKLSVTENGNLENKLSQFSKEGGVTLVDSVETLGVDLRTRVKRLGAKEKARRKKVQC